VAEERIRGNARVQAAFDRMTAYRPGMADRTSTLLQRPVAEARTVSDLVEAATEGAVRSPPFQRGFRWHERDVRDLFDSIWRGFPIGSLLLWERAAPAAKVHFGSLAVDAPEMNRALWVVDGQHRLTALVATLVEHDHPAPEFELYFDLYEDAFVRRGARRTPPPHWLPMSVVLDTNRLLDRLGELRDEGLEHDAVDKAREVARVIAEYKIPVAIVTTDDERVLREIFHRVNSAGRRMTAAEVFRALHAALGQGDPGDLRSLIDEIGALGFGAPREDTVLRCVLAVRGGDVYRSFEHEFSDDEDPADTFRLTAETLTRVFAFLRDDAAIPHIRALPYAGVLPILTRFFALHPSPHPRSRNLLRRWLWRGSVAWGRDVGMLRRVVQEVDSDEYGSVARLLQGLGEAGPPELDLNAVQLNKAAAKMNVALLSSLRPRDLRDGELVDVGDLLDDDEPQAFLEVVPSTNPALAGRLLHGTVTDDDVSALILAANQQILDSHAIPAEAVAALRANNADMFAQIRGAELGRRLRDRREQLAESAADDHPPISSLIVSDP
jgi:hypothetical protein